jgi:hypothetical protein
MNYISHSDVEEALAGILGEGEEVGALALQPQSKPAVRAALIPVIRGALQGAGAKGFAAGAASAGAASMRPGSSLYAGAKYKLLPSVPNVALGAMGPGATVVFTARPQKHCKVIGLQIGGTVTAATEGTTGNALGALMINTITVGADSMMIGVGTMSAAAFAPDSPHPIEFNASIVGADIVVSLTNVDATKTFTSVQVSFVVKTLEE